MASRHTLQISRDRPLALADSALPSLQRLICPRAATQTLRQIWAHSAWSSSVPAPQVSAVQLLRYHRGSRCTLFLTLDQCSASGCIAKVYASRDAATAEAMRAVNQAAFAQRGTLRIPALLAAIPELHLLVTAVAQGQSVRDEVRSGNPGAAREAARWLAAFHTAPLPVPASFMLHDPLALAHRWTRRLQAALPEVAADAATVLAALVNAPPRWPPHARMLHGDFGAGHVFVAPQATTVIDWDSCRYGDPAEDGGRFLASLHDLAVRRRADTASVARAVACFRAAYVAAMPDAATALPFYTALACLRKASRITGSSVAHRERARLLLKAGYDALASAHFA